MANLHCESCNKQVGSITKRNTKAIWGLVIGALAVFFLLVSMAMQSPAERFLSQQYGAQSSSVPSDVWLIIPLGMIVMAVALYFQGKEHCPACNSELTLDKKGENK